MTYGYSGGGQYLPDTGYDGYQSGYYGGYQPPPQYLPAAPAPPPVQQPMPPPQQVPSKKDVTKLVRFLFFFLIFICGPTVKALAFDGRTMFGPKILQDFLNLKSSPRFQLAKPYDS